MVARILWRSSQRYFLRHPWQTLLSIAGILLGVAVVVAVDLANESALRAFRLSMEGLTGRATHQLVGNVAGIPESFYTELRIKRHIRQSAPVIEGYVQLGNETLRLLGVDPLAERGFQRLGDDLDQRAMVRLMSQRAVVLMAATNMQRHGLADGDAISLKIDGQTHVVTIIGKLSTDPPALSDGLLLTDIATAQELLNRVGALDRIELDLTEAEVHALSANLPSGIRLTTAEQRTATMEQMTDAFRVNLLAMSLLALLVGGFLIFNTMTFTVVQRREYFGDLRILGVTPRELLTLVLIEAMSIGLLGTLLGLATGALIGRGLVGLVTRTINDLYFVLTVNQYLISPGVLLKGLVIGLFVTLIAAMMPAIEAARSRPQVVQRRSTLEQRSYRLLPWLTLVGVVLAISGLWLGQYPSRNLLPGFFALFLLLMGFSLLIPILVLGFAKLAKSSFSHRGGLINRLAIRGLSATLSRTGPAVAALTIAVSATVGVAIMIQSFRDTVAVWLDQTLRSDIYISAPSPTSNRAEGKLRPEVRTYLQTLPEIKEVSTGRSVMLETNRGPVQVLIIDMASRSHKGIRFKTPPLANIWSRFRQGEVMLVSEPYAFHNQIKVGDSVRLFSDQGWKSFPVGGIFYDYGSDRGTLVLARSAYDRLWQDSAISTIGVFLEDGVNSETALERIYQTLSPLQQTLRIRSNRTIREHSLTVFDRTFAITQVLRWLAVGVAFIGILSALMSLQLERAREYALLRATGFTPWQLTRLILTQTAILGFLTGLLALPLGLLMSDILINVINVRAFGWTMEYSLPKSVLLEAIALALASALLAGTYPAYRLAITRPALALREE